MSLVTRLEQRWRCGYTLGSRLESHALGSLTHTGKEVMAGTSLVDRVEAGLVLRLYSRSCRSLMYCAPFDCTGKETVAGTSLVNRVEAEMVLRLYGALTAAAPHLRDRPAIGVISPYKAQVPAHPAASRQALL